MILIVFLLFSGWVCYVLLKPPDLTATSIARIAASTEPQSENITALPYREAEPDV